MIEQLQDWGLRQLHLHKLPGVHWDSGLRGPGDHAEAEIRQEH